MTHPVHVLVLSERAGYVKYNIAFAALACYARPNPLPDTPHRTTSV
jgi:hypothetical protein